MIRSRDNPQVKRWAKLARDTRFRKSERRALIEGPHLVSSLLDKGLKPRCLLVSEGNAGNPEVIKLLERARLEPIELSQSAFRSIVDARTPQGIAAEIEIRQGEAVSSESCVFLEGIQDPGNVGAIIRSSAAFGVGALVLDRECADAWSPKVLRAGMGGHFALQIRQVADLPAELEGFEGKLICTVPRGGTTLAEADLVGALGWLFGSEGKGLSAEVQKKAALRVSIPIAPGTDSLNVAAAAAICLYEKFSKPASGS